MVIFVVHKLYLHEHVQLHLYNRLIITDICSYMYMYKIYPPSIRAA